MFVLLELLLVPLRVETRMHVERRWGIYPPQV
jgi:hypothetical protein